MNGFKGLMNSLIHSSLQVCVLHSSLRGSEGNTRAGDEGGMLKERRCMEDIYFDVLSFANKA